MRVTERVRVREGLLGTIHMVRVRGRARARGSPSSLHFDPAAH